MEQETKESYEKKVKFEGEVKCPHCGFFLVVKADKNNKDDPPKKKRGRPKKE
jgi:uncharacterized Zn finger protein (UPF0148 family)